MGFSSKNSHLKARHCFSAASIVNGEKKRTPTPGLLLQLLTTSHLSQRCCSFVNTETRPLPRTCLPGYICLRWISFCPVLSFLRSFLFPSSCTFGFQHCWPLLHFTVSCVVPSLKLSSSVWPAFCKHYLGSTLSEAFPLLLPVLHPQSGSHGCTSQNSVNITSCTTRLLTCRCWN